MGSWIVLAIQLTLSVATLLASLAAVAWARASSKNGKETKYLLEALSALVNKFHGSPYPPPSAVVTEAQPEPSPTPAPARALVRSLRTGAPIEGEALEEARTRGLTVAMARPAGLPVRVVSVTRDDDPVHTRETLELRRERESGEEPTQVMDLPDRATLFPELPEPPTPTMLSAEHLRSKKP